MNLMPSKYRKNNKCCANMKEHHDPVKNTSLVLSLSLCDGIPQWFPVGAKKMKSKISGINRGNFDPSWFLFWGYHTL